MTCPRCGTNNNDFSWKCKSCFHDLKKNSLTESEIDGDLIAQSPVSANLTSVSVSPRYSMENEVPTVTQPYPSISSEKRIDSHFTDHHQNLHLPLNRTSACQIKVHQKEAPIPSQYHQNKYFVYTAVTTIFWLVGVILLIFFKMEPGNNLTVEVFSNDNIAMLMEKAEKAFHQRQYLIPQDDNVIKYTTEILKQYPSHLGALELQAEVLDYYEEKAEQAIKNYRYEAAVRYFRNILRIDPNDDRIREKLASLENKLY